MNTGRRRDVSDDDLLAALSSCTLSSVARPQLLPILHSFQPAKRHRTQHSGEDSTTRLTGAPLECISQMLVSAVRLFGEIEWIYVDRSGDGIVKWTTVEAAARAVADSGIRSLQLRGLSFAYISEEETRERGVERRVNERTMRIYRHTRRAEALFQQRNTRRAARRAAIKAATWTFEEQ